MTTTKGKCEACLFCEELSEGTVRCSNADLADEAGWVDTYWQLGYLEFDEPVDPPCFWFVPKEKGLSLY